MRAHERRLILRTIALGVVLTVGVIVVDWLGGLRTLENWFYDGRARACQFFVRAPTDQLVYVLIDDDVLEAVGKWPWARSDFAALLDEIDAAGARAIAMDIWMTDRQKLDVVVRADGGIDQIDHDAILAQTMGSIGTVMVPIVFDLQGRGELSALDRALESLLVADLELESDEALGRLVASGLVDDDAQGLMRVNELFYLALHRAMLVRVQAMLEQSPASYDDVRLALLPSLDLMLYGGPRDQRLERVYEQALALRALRGYARPMESVADFDGRAFIQSHTPGPTMRVLSEQAAASGFVDFLPYDDGVVRALPLWVRHGDWVYPQIGLALACWNLGIVPGDIVIESDRLRLPLEEGRWIDVPTRAHRSRLDDQSIGMMFDVPWIGKTNQWHSMLDPHHEQSVNQISAVQFWKIEDLQRKQVQNNRRIDGALLSIWEIYEPDKFSAYEKNRPALDDFSLRVDAVKQTLQLLDDFEVVKTLTSGSPESTENVETAESSGSIDKLSLQDQQLLAAAQVLPVLFEHSQQIDREIISERARLQSIVAGKSVLIGWSATGAAADFVPTPLHGKCPGVMVHGSVFNGIMSGEMWRTAPGWVAVLLTLLMGGVSTWLAARLAPVLALVAALGLLAFYAVLNGVVFFDWGDTVVGMAGPMVVIVATWSGCTLFRLTVERAERARITKRFQSYVDPALVNYVIENPDQARLDGEVREMTVVFTDLAGFTTLSEKLREQTVTVLSEYLGMMTPIIRAHEGYVNKFLGDGMMFFYGAPRVDMKRHDARHAVATVLEMYVALQAFNLTLVERNLPSLAMRAGITTGRMVVGDAGPADASDYTVLGDEVNLAARLESANKATGTQILTTHRTIDLLDDTYIHRPIGQLRVVGKTQAVMIHEPLGMADQITDDQKRLIEKTTLMVEAFMRGALPQCLELCDDLATLPGQEKLVAMYRAQCQHFMSDAHGDEEFEGIITLSSK